MASEYNQISNGPSKFDLMVSLFDGNKTPRRSVIFISEGKELEVGVSMIEQEDGSGESWNFKGYVIGVTGKRIEGYYSSKTRTGTFKFKLTISR